MELRGKAQGHLTSLIGSSIWAPLAQQLHPEEFGESISEDALMDRPTDIGWAWCLFCVLCCLAAFRSHV
jgi:hypothetical protein